MSRTFVGGRTMTSLPVRALARHNRAEISQLQLSSQSQGLAKRLALQRQRDRGQQQKRSLSLVACRAEESNQSSGSNTEKVWEEYYDEKTKGYYYFDRSSGTTQWDKPSNAKIINKAKEDLKSQEESVESLEARLGVGRKGREMRAQAAASQPQEQQATAQREEQRNRDKKVKWEEGSLLPEGWDEMDTGDKIIQGVWGERGFLFWLNWLSYRFIFVMLGGWILFRFVGPALNIYQLTNPFDANNIPL